MPPIRLGIVGCGEVTQILHLPSLRQLPDQFAVTALCDVSPAVLGTVADQWGVATRLTDYRELAGRADLDAVLVANPDAFHAEAALAAIAAGKHVLIEKPMCMTLREADAIIAAQAQHGVTVQVGYMRRYAPAFVKACELLPTLGPIRLARVHDLLGANSMFIQHTSLVARANDIPADLLAASAQQRDALITEAIGESNADLRRAYGLLLSLSSHDLSAMRELLGMPRRILTATQRQAGGYLTATFDYGDFVCQFETGTDAIPRFDAFLEVYTEHHVLRVSYDTPYVRNLPIQLTVTEANGAGGTVVRSEHPAWGDPFVTEWQAFFQNVTERREPKTPPRDARHDLELFRDLIGLMR